MDKVEVCMLCDETYFTEEGNILRVCPSCTPATFEEQALCWAMHRVLESV